MKKLLFFLIVFYSITSNAQSGIWICKNYRVIDSSQGWNPGFIGGIIDFDKQEVSSVIKTLGEKIVINKSEKRIDSLDHRGSLTYKLYKKDSIEVLGVHGRVVSVFQPLILNRKIPSTKSSLIKILTKKKFHMPKDSIRFQFLNVVNENWEKVEVKEQLYQARSDPERKGIWFLNEIQSNFFIGITDNVQGGDWIVYRILSVNQKEILLKPFISRENRFFKGKRLIYRE